MINTMFDAWTAMAFGGMGNLLPRTARAPLRHKVGRFSGNEFRNHAGALQYKLYIPGSYDGTPMPLIVMLHGCGQNADDFALGTGMNELAEEYGCLVLYPEQSRSANWHACWNWFDEAHHGRDKGEPALIAGLTQSIMANYAVDEQSVSIAGLSAGGAMAVILGRTYPDLYTAVGCHSGLAHGSATSGHGALTAMRDGVQENLHGSVLPRDMLANGVPIIVFHGDQDETVHLSHSSGVVRQSIGVCDPCMVETAAETVHSAGGSASKHAFTCSIHRDHAGDVLAEQWTVHGAGHAWSGGSVRGTYTDWNGPNASKEMLRFFTTPR